VAEKRRARGLEWAQRAVATDPEETSCIYNVGCVYALSGKSESAWLRGARGGYIDIDSCRKHGVAKPQGASLIFSCITQDLSGFRTNRSCARSMAKIWKGAASRRFEFRGLLRICLGEGDGEPILFKGDDFTHTDLSPVLT